MQRLNSPSRADHQSFKALLKIGLWLGLALVGAYSTPGQQPVGQQPSTPKSVPRTQAGPSAQPQKPSPSPAKPPTQSQPVATPQATPSPQPTPFAIPSLPGPSPVPSSQASPAAAPSPSPSLGMQLPQSASPLTLDEALRLANAQSSSFVSAGLNERIAAEDVRQAQAAFLPKVSAPLSYIYTSPALGLEPDIS